jgi:hypothetical protein
MMRQRKRGRKFRQHTQLASRRHTRSGTSRRAQPKRWPRRGQRRRCRKSYGGEERLVAPLRNKHKCEIRRNRGCVKLSHNTTHSLNALVNAQLCESLSSGQECINNNLKYVTEPRRKTVINCSFVNYHKCKVGSQR